MYPDKRRGCTNGNVDVFNTPVSALGIYFHSNLCKQKRFLMLLDKQIRVSLCSSISIRATHNLRQTPEKAIYAARAMRVALLTRAPSLYCYKIQPQEVSRGIRKGHVTPFHVHIARILMPITNHQIRGRYF